MELESSTVSLRRKQYELALQLWEEGQNEEQIFIEYQKRNIKTNKSLDGFKIQINRMRKEFGWFSREMIVKLPPKVKVQPKEISQEEKDLAFQRARASIPILSSVLPERKPQKMSKVLRATIKNILKDEILKGAHPRDVLKGRLKGRLAVGSLYNLSRELAEEFVIIKELLIKIGFDTEGPIK